jgi:hypothetical protein
MNRKEFVYVKSTGRIMKDKLEKVFETGKEVSFEIFSYMKKYLLDIYLQDIKN